VKNYYMFWMQCFIIQYNILPPSLSKYLYPVGFQKNYYYIQYSYREYIKYTTTTSSFSEFSEVIVLPLSCKTALDTTVENKRCKLIKIVLERYSM